MDTIIITLTLLSNSILSFCARSEEFPVLYDPGYVDLRFPFNHGYTTNIESKNGDYFKKQGRVITGEYNILNPDRSIKIIAIPKKGLQDIKKENGKILSPKIASKSYEDRKSLKEKLDSVLDYYALHAIRDRKYKEHLAEQNNREHMLPYKHAHSFKIHYPGGIRDTQRNYKTISYPNKKYKRDEANDLFSIIVEMDLAKNSKHTNFHPRQIVKTDKENAHKGLKNDAHYYQQPIKNALHKVFPPFEIQIEKETPQPSHIYYEPLPSFIPNLSVPHNLKDESNIYNGFNSNQLYPDNKYSIRLNTDYDINKQIVNNVLSYKTIKNNHGLMLFSNMKSYKGHTKLINPNFRFSSYLPPDYEIGNIDNRHSLPHYILDYETRHSPQNKSITENFSRTGHGRILGKTQKLKI